VSLPRPAPSDEILPERFFARRGWKCIRGRIGRARKETVVEHACLELFVDHPPNDAVRDSPVENVRR
jgi:hypothetical protein